jgi:hypothetical protein
MKERNQPLNNPKIVAPWACWNCSSICWRGNCLTWLARNNYSINLLQNLFHINELCLTIVTLISENSLKKKNLAFKVIHGDANQTAQELRENDMSYFERAVTSKTLKDVLSFDNTQA